MTADVHRLAIIRMDKSELLSPDDRRWWETQAPVSLQCEVRSQAARCGEAAEYVLTFRGKTGYCCVRCLASQLVGLTRFGPVLVEKLP